MAGNPSIPHLAARLAEQKGNKLAMPQSTTNRGRDWELLLCQTFARTHGCSIVKTDPAVKEIAGTRQGGRFMAVYCAPGLCDFEGGYRGRHVCIEAKQSQSRYRWNVAEKIADHQVARLNNAVKFGEIAGLALRFRAADPMNDVMWLVDWASFLAVDWLHKTISCEEANEQIQAGVGVQLLYAGPYLRGVSTWLDRHVSPSAEVSHA